MARAPGMEVSTLNFYPPVSARKICVLFFCVLLKVRKRKVRKIIVKFLVESSFAKKSEVVLILAEDLWPVSNPQLFPLTRIVLNQWLSLC